MLKPVKKINIVIYRTRVFNQIELNTPRPGLEPGTERLTVVCSTIELSRIILLNRLLYIYNLFSARTPTPYFLQALFSLKAQEGYQQH